jgi:outer membrane protein OmpA-like peptidoglycan-associated protein
LFAAIILAGCAQNRCLVILLPDADGKVGTIEVQNKRGARLVTEPYHAVKTGMLASAPSKPRPLQKQHVEEAFSHALGAEPEQRFRISSIDIYFRKDSSELTSDSQQKLPEIISGLKHNAPFDIYLAGHADRVGTEKYNRHLSYQRALAVQDALIAGGISAQIIMLSYFGESSPPIDTADEVEEPSNRRVMLYLRHPKS